MKTKRVLLADVDAFTEEEEKKLTDLGVIVVYTKQGIHFSMLPWIFPSGEEEE